MFIKYVYLYVCIHAHMYVSIVFFSLTFDLNFSVHPLSQDMDQRQTSSLHNAPICITLLTRSHNWPLFLEFLEENIALRILFIGVLIV